MESKHKIKLDISEFVDPNIIYKPTDKRGAEIARRYEAEVLRFANHFKTRRGSMKSTDSIRQLRK